MKKLILLAAILFCTGCTGKGLLLEIPNTAFERFEYHRAGNMTSMHILAIDSKRTNDTYTIKSVHVIGDYGPFANFNIKIDGYKREIGE